MRQRVMGGILCRENCLKRVKRQESEKAVGLLKEWQVAHLGWDIDLGIMQRSFEQHVGTGSLRVSPHQTKRPGLPWACWGESMRTADGGNNKMESGPNPRSLAGSQESRVVGGAHTHWLTSHPLGLYFRMLSFLGGGLAQTSSQTPTF